MPVLIIIIMCFSLFLTGSCPTGEDIVQTLKETYSLSACSDQVTTADQ